MCNAYFFAHVFFRLDVGHVMFFSDFTLFLKNVPGGADDQWFHTGQSALVSYCIFPATNFQCPPPLRTQDQPFEVSNPPYQPQQRLPSVEQRVTTPHHTTTNLKRMFSIHFQNRWPSHASATIHYFRDDTNNCFFLWLLNFSIVSGLIEQSALICQPSLTLGCQNDKRFSIS